MYIYILLGILILFFIIRYAVKSAFVEVLNTENEQLATVIAEGMEKYDEFDNLIVNEDDMDDEPTQEELAERREFESVRPA